MKNLSQWPSLAAGTGAGWPAELRYSRAVWGKVHGARSDYRWIALSAGLVPEADLHEQLNVGVEDEPQRTLLWRNLNGRCHAVICYPSKATDFSGRTGFLEKQVLCWDRSDLPAALGALLLLPHAAGLTDAIWWSRYEGQSWSDPDFALPIDPLDHEPLFINQDDLAATVKTGLEEIRSNFGIDSLQTLYSALLAGNKPAFLTGASQPLSAAALAALLLPLPREHADCLSLAAWVPSRRILREELAKRWDVVVLPPGRADLEVKPAVVDRHCQDEGRRLAEELLGLGSDPLAGLPSQPFKPVEEPPPPSLRKPEPVEVPSGRPVPGHTIDLASPAARAPQALKDLHAFACATDRRWLEAEALSGVKPGQLDYRDSPIPEWIRILRERRPSWVDEQQWAVKLDLLRCADLVLHPHRNVAMPETGRIPALYFVPSLPSSDRDLLGKLGSTTLQNVLAQSLSLGNNPRTKKMKAFIERWQIETKCQDPAIQAMAGNALRSTSA